MMSPHASPSVAGPVARQAAAPVFRRPKALPCATWLALATLWPALPVAAQIVPTGTPAADILMARALSEQRVFLTCSALDGQAHPLILQGWERDVAAATAILTANAVPPEAIAAFTAAARPESLMPAPDTAWSEVNKLCDAYPDWQADYGRLNFTILELKLPKVFE